MKSKTIIKEKYVDRRHCSVYCSAVRSTVKFTQVASRCTSVCTVRVKTIQRVCHVMESSLSTFFYLSLYYLFIYIFFNRWIFCRKDHKCIYMDFNFHDASSQTNCNIIIPIHANDYPVYVERFPTGEDISDYSVTHSDGSKSVLQGKIII